MKRSFLVATALLMTAGLAIPAWAGAGKRFSESELPDGLHFYGQTTSPTQGGADYLVFYKQGDNVRGIGYAYATSFVSCFTGTLDSNTITDATIAAAPPEGTNQSQWEVSSGHSFNLEGLYPLEASEIPVEVTEELKTCSQVNYVLSQAQ